MPGRTEKINYLRAMDLFQGLTAEEIDSIEKMANMFSCQRGQLLYSPEETREVLFFLKKGSVHLYRLSPEGKKLVIATLEPNTFFGEMALVGQRMYGTFAEAEENSLLCTMTREDVARMLSMKPAIALNLVQILGKRVLEIEDTLEDLAFKSMRARIASILLRISEQRQDNKLSGVRHQDLAERAATLRETVTGVLAEFKTAGLVELGWRKIVILDKDRLKQIAEG